MWNKGIEWSCPQCHYYYINICWNLLHGWLAFYSSCVCFKQEGKTALYWAVEKGYNEIVRLLLASEPDLELCTKVSTTIKLNKLRKVWRERRETDRQIYKILLGFAFLSKFNKKLSKLGKVWRERRRETDRQTDRQIQKILFRFALLSGYVSTQMKSHKMQVCNKCSSICPFGRG